MCGIIGFNWQDENLALRLKDSLVHRGPDQSGIYCDDSVSLAHRRLSILDLSDKGRQPMQSEDGAITVVFNGEIFNYQKLRDELIKKGHTFQSHTDTEVLVHLYEDLGSDMIAKINGQFAFCIYDKPNKTLLLARDRAGIIPLFYFYDKDRFIFSSELKGIIQSGIPKEIDDEALIFYLRFGFISAPKCILKGVSKLEPAHYMMYDLAGKKIKLNERYWDIAFNSRITDIQEAVGVIREGLRDAARIRLMGDVPVGAFLSGGVDSSAVVATIVKEKKKLKTFSVSFEEKEYDESSYAKKVADFFKTEHYEIPLRPGDVRDIIPELVDHYDEPFGDSSAIPTYVVSKCARQHVTVCLSGDGADELLGGYDRYRYFVILRFLNMMPRGVKVILRAILDLVLRIYPRFKLERIRELLGFRRLPDIELYEKLVEKIDRQDLERLLKRPVKFEDTTSRIKNREGLDALQHYDMVHYLEGDILTKVDRAAMSVSLETRPPFLDHRFMELCFSMNRQIKIRGSRGKWILKEAFKNELPADIIKRRKKGFGVPLKKYLENDLADLVDRYVFNYTGHDMFDRHFLKGMKDRRRPKDTARLYWNILIFNMWHEKWI